ncbi:DEAD/DEAH box helicase [Microvirga massiliensis]|uniref:DEAD/DEAH box helicase n=1 Tax=Microvirga massiliensis TaxID=1033741 RepID=UPI00062B6E04|nr:AAA domain-containing protein [Microvirga massiliensis]
MTDVPMKDLVAEMRRSLYDTSLRNRLVNLSLDRRARIIRFTGLASEIRDQLSRGDILELGSDLLKTTGSAEEARSKLKDVVVADNALRDEQGISSLQIGLGLLKWIDESGSDPRERYAPLLLWPVQVIIGRDRITIRATDTVGEINETFLAKVGVPIEAIPEDPLAYRPKATHAPIVELRDDASLSLFSQARRAMARRMDHEANPRLIEHLTFVALVAASRRRPGASPQMPAPSRAPSELSPERSANVHVTPPDTSQDRAVTITRQGSDLLIQGPPGTGKTQTIVNIIANGIEDGKRILFMAEKMNAIDAVWQRIKSSRYAKRILMLQGDALNRKAIAEQLDVPDVSGIIDILRSCPTQRLPSVIMTSPAAYALHVPEEWQFDMLIVDEASQMHLSAAAAGIASSRQIVVCGDSQQMPPNKTFQAALDAVVDGNPSTSLLTAADLAGMPTTMLERHYRSRHPSLIDMSNRVFYKGRLQQVPSPWPASNIGLKYYYVGGTYGRGTDNTNPTEAQAVVEAVRRQVKNGSLWSIGIIAMNERQRSLIESMLQDEINAHRVSASEPLFVRTVENVQGEERDIIYISMTYGPDHRGISHSNFGSLSDLGGEKRVNVMMSRARYRMEIFNSIDFTIARKSGNFATEILCNFLWAAKKGSISFVGASHDSPLARVLGAYDYTTEQYNQAICVRDGTRRYIGAVYLTGKSHPLDELSERSQLKAAGWKLARFRAECLDADHPGHRDAVEALIQELDGFKRPSLS